MKGAFFSSSKASIRNRNKLVIFSLFVFLSSVYCLQHATSEELVTLDFKDQNIQDILPTVSEVTGRNFMIDDGIQTKVTIVSSSKLNPENAYQFFMQELKRQGLCGDVTGEITRIRFCNRHRKE